MAKRGKAKGLCRLVDSDDELLNSTVGDTKNSDLNDKTEFNIRLPQGCHTGRARAKQSNMKTSEK